MGHDTRPVPSPAPVWQAGSRAAPMPPLLPIPLCPPQEQGQLPKVQVGWPCPGYGADCLPNSRALLPPQRALQMGPESPFSFLLSLYCQGNMSPGEESSLWDTHGRKGMAEVLADAGQNSQQGCPTPTPQGPIPSPGGCRFVPWQGTERAGGSVPGYGMARLFSSSVPPGSAPPARLGHAPKAPPPAEDASDASEAAWGER